MSVEPTSSRPPRPRPGFGSAERPVYTLTRVSFFRRRNRHKNRRPVSRENRAGGRGGSRSSPTTAAFRSPVERTLLNPHRAEHFFSRRRLITPGLIRTQPHYLAFCSGESSTPKSLEWTPLAIT